MTALTDPDRTRLVRLLGMLGSAHDGERANAASLAHKMLQDRKLTWNDVIAHGPNGAGVDPARPFYQPPPPPPKPPPRPSPLRSWRQVAEECAEHLEQLNDWESEFVEGLGRWNALTPKQAAKLRDIATGLGVPLWMA